MTTQLMSGLKGAKLIALVFVIAQLHLLTASAEALNSFVSHFEPLNYDRDSLESIHQRVRRSLDEDTALYLDFNAHGREFKLRLKRDTTIFTPDFDDEGDFDPAKVYRGHVDGHSGSLVHGFVHKGIFEGNIKLSDKLEDEYHVEPSSDHFDTPKDFHSVIYKASDLHYPYAYGKDLDLSEKIKKWMEESRTLSDEHFVTPEKAPETHRYRRNADEKLICQIHLRADHLFTTRRAKGDAERAKLLMSKHVQVVHEIYKQTLFKINGDQKNGFGFAIKKMRANDSSDTNEKKNNPYAQEYIGVEKFLDIISLEETDNNLYCLSHVFTYRDFEDGVLGLAWVGEPAGKAAGGICEVARRYSDGRKKTLNTGVVTFINYNQEVPSRISEVTFAHELGHNFGAKHDTSDCSGGAGGNYIMFPKATSGTDTNNRKFSSCSKNFISPVIQSKGTCFQGTNDSICGNQVVEKGEQCDCGFGDDCEKNKDKCCNPADHDDRDMRCKYDRLKNVKCSPSEGLCCDKTCGFSSNNKLCANGNCINDTFCSGTAAKCPTPIHKADNTDCNNNKSVCLNGICSGSRCLKYAKKECQCEQSDYQCVLCCMDDKKVCKPHNETGVKEIKLLPGAPCDNFQGYCDVLKKCRGVDSEGPLERIKNLLFGGDAINNLVDWVKTYWWAAILIGIGLILLMAGFIKLCSVATPSSNPNKPKAKTLSLRRNPRPNPGFINEPPPAYDIEMANRGGRAGRH